MSALTRLQASGQAEEHGKGIEKYDTCGEGLGPDNPHIKAKAAFAVGRFERWQRHPQQDP